MSHGKVGKRGVWMLGVALVVLALVAAGCGASGQAANSGSTSSSSASGSTSGTGSGSTSALPAATNAAATGATEQPPAQATAMTAATEAPATGGATAGGAGATGPAELMLGNDSKLGQFLVDSKGMSLYLYTKDTKDTSNCYDKCAVAWPPLLTQGQAKAGTGLDAKLLGTTTRKDGTMQVTYGGWPLYYYQKDKKAGDVTGQDVGSVWYVVSPKGEKIEK